MASTGFGGIGGETSGGSSSIAMIAGLALAAGLVVFPDGGGLARLSRADDLGTSAPTVGIAKAAALSGASVAVITGGKVTLADWTPALGTMLLTPGITYYLSPTVAGGLTTIPPLADGRYAVRVGTALTTTDLNVEIEMVFPQGNIGFLATETLNRITTENALDYLVI